jgi:hypothetical protein
VKVDGVVSIDPVGLSYLLGATGPVQVGDLSLTKDNLVSELLNNTYLTVVDPDQQDDRFKAIASTVFSKVTAGGFDARTALAALKEAADQHRLYVHSFHADENKLLARTAVQGAVVTDPKAPPQVGVYVDDNTGGKISYYLHYRVEVAATSCRNGVQSLAATATFRSSAPADAATSLPAAVTGGGAFGIPAGDELVAVHVYGPVGGTIGAVTLAGKPVQGVKVVELDGRPVATVFVYLGAAKSVDATWTMRTGAGQTGDAQVRVTPGIDPTSGDSVVTSAC